MPKSTESWISPELRAAMGAAEAAPVKLAAGELLIFGRADRERATPFADTGPALAAKGFHPIPLKPWGALFKNRDGSPHPAAQAHIDAGRNPADFTGPHQAAKAPAIGDWQRYCTTPPTAAEIAEWANPRHRYGVGGACGEAMIGVDLDIDDPAMLAACVAAIPKTPYGKRGRRGGTLLFRGHPTLRKRAIKLVRDIVDPVTGETTTVDAGGIDFLARGAQTVLPPSIHPQSGWPFQWCGSDETTGDKSLLDIGHARDLPVLVPPEVDSWDGVIAALLAALAPLGVRLNDGTGKGRKAGSGRRTGAGARSASSGAPKADRRRSARNLGALAGMLKHIDADDRAACIETGFVLFTYFAGDQTGFDVFDRWCATSAKFADDPGWTRACWDDFAKRESKGQQGKPLRTMGSLVADARAAGWVGRLFDGHRPDDGQSEAFGAHGVPAHRFASTPPVPPAFAAKVTAALRGLLGSPNDADDDVLVLDAADMLAANRVLFGEWAAALRENGWTVAEVKGFYAALAGMADALAPANPGDLRFASEAVMVAALNRRLALVKLKGRARVVDDRRDGLTFGGKVTDAADFDANVTFLTPKVEAATKTEPERWTLTDSPAMRAWSKSKRVRKHAGGVEFRPLPWGADGSEGGGFGADNPAGPINSWRGWKSAPLLNQDRTEDRTGEKCALFRRHVADVICDGDAAYADWFWKLYAHMVQRPAEIPGVAVVLKGGRGSGKDTVAAYLRAMIGDQHAGEVGNMDRLTGRFNSHFNAKLFMGVQEAYWAGDRKAEGVVKNLITSDNLQVELKGVDAFNAPSYLRLMLSANEDWAVFAGIDERRFFALRVSDKRIGDKPYFDALYAELAGDGPAALHAWLRGIDLSGFNPRKPPDTDELVLQKLQSLRDVDRFVFDRFVLPDWWRSDSPDGGFDPAYRPVIASADLVADYQLWAKEAPYGRDRNLSPRAIMKRLRAWLPGAEPARTESAKGWQLPTLADARAAFEARIGGRVDWDDDDGGAGDEVDWD